MGVFGKLSQLYVKFAIAKGEFVGNFEIYRRTLRFSIMRFVLTIVGILIVVALPLITFFATSAAGLEEGTSLIATGAALAVGFIIFVLVARYCGYLYTAAQVAMITEGVAHGSLPDDVCKAGKQAVKKRFATSSVYFALWSITKAITNEISAGLNALSRTVEGDKPGPLGVIAGIVSAVVSVVLEYLNYCSLGWVFLNGNQSAFKSTCDGAVIYFKNWKTLMKNSAKVIAITIVSLAIIGGAFFAAAYFILGSIAPLTNVLAEIDAAATMEDGTAVPAGTSLVVLCVIIALLIWSGIHNAVVKPYILVSVMRRYIEAGLATAPTPDAYDKLSGMSKCFNQALDKARAEEAPAA